MDKLFISSVGTGIGKTLVTTILCRQLTQLGRSVAAIKPVVSGFRTDLESDPAPILRSLGKKPSLQTISEIAPWRFAQPVSPHLAARNEGGGPSLPEVVAFCRVPTQRGRYPPHRGGRWHHDTPWRELYGT